MNRYLLTFIALTIYANGKAQSISDDATISVNHELTIFVLRSASPLDWESPAALYKSYRKSVITNFTKKERTIKGHFFIRLSTPLLKEPLYAGVVGADRTEEKRLFFIEKIGFSIFGTTMKGTLHGRDALLKKIKVHEKNRDIAYLKIRLSESGARQIIRYYNSFTTEVIPGYKPVDFYGGAFWPLYKNEGSGCSAFALAILDLIDVHEFETESWIKTVYIPMELIGGEINNDKKVKVRGIKKTKQWADGNGIENSDFVKFEIYDPSTAFYWIINRNKNIDLAQKGIVAQSESEIPGLFIDKSVVEFDTTAPIISNRPDRNFFVDFHHKKLESLK